MMASQFSLPSLAERRGRRYVREGGEGSVVAGHAGALRGGADEGERQVVVLLEGSNYASATALRESIETG